LIREYARHVEAVRACGADDRLLPMQKTAKNRWQVDSRGEPAVRVTYRVYGREMTVRTNWIEAGFAMLNGAPTFISVVGDVWRAHEVHVQLAEGWTTASTALAAVDPLAHVYSADNFDMLVDSPIVLGNSVARQFTFAERLHTVVFEGDPALIDADRVASDLRKIVEAAACLMGGRVDYPHYHFLNMVVDAGGGLEHGNCLLVMMNRFATRTRRAYVGYLGLAAHEFFHVWNIKRLRPIELGPFDYENEVYTRALWICEGFTEYYAALLPKRAGLTTNAEFFEDLSNHIETLQTTPGRLVNSAAMASFDTWIKQYRPDENTPNTTINYYPKGAVIAFLLDAHLRRATGGERSLDDVMRLAYERYSGTKGYTLEEFSQTISAVAGADLAGWVATAAESTDELDYAEALDWFGLRFGPAETRHARASIGAHTRDDAGRLMVSQVRRDTPAYAAGVNVADEIVAIDDVRVTADGLASRLEQYRPGDVVSVLIARRERLTHLSVTLAAEPGRAWRLEPLPGATDVQKERLIGWLGERRSRGPHS
jgi:predicted metalloprotease with PDZ domain